MKNDWSVNGESHKSIEQNLFYNKSLVEKNPYFNKDPLEEYNIKYRDEDMKELMQVNMNEDC